MRLSQRIVKRRLACLLLATAALAAAAPPPARARTVAAATPISRLDAPWWRARHDEKLAELKRGPVDLIFLGDSITQDYERAGPPSWQDFRPVWDRFYGDRHAVNLGFSGDATSHLLWRIEHGEVDGIAPKVAVVLIGANNLGRLHWPTADNLAGIDAVVSETQRRLPHTKILLLSILPSERTAWASETTLATNQALASRYGRDAVAGVTWLDLTVVFSPRGAFDRTLFLDPLLTPPQAPLHPSAEGQARMAAAIEPTLAGLLGEPSHTR